MRRTLAIIGLLLIMFATARVQGALIQEGIIQESCTAFPSVSSPSLSVLPNGSLLAVFCESTRGGIYGKLSNDDGLSWTNAFLIKPSTTECKVLSNFLLVDVDKVLLVYSRLTGNLSIWKLESYDCGQTWVNDSRVDTGVHGYICTGTNGLRTRNGTLIVPIAWEGNASVLRSDDGGLTWFEGEPVHIANDWWTMVDEPSVVELENRSLYCLFRTYGYNRHFCAVSNDYGLTWSECLPVEEMCSFNTTPALFRYSWTPNIILSAWINRISDVDSFQRRPLVIAYSSDDCNSWRAITVLDEGASTVLNVTTIDGETISVESKTSMNEPAICRSDKYVLVGYRRYPDAFMPFKAISDAVIRRLVISVFCTKTSLCESFSSSSPIDDLNNDGTVNILDAIMLANE